MVYGVKRNDFFLFANKTRTIVRINMVLKRVYFVVFGWHFVISVYFFEKQTINVFFFLRYTLRFKKHFTLVTWHFC